MRLKHMRFGNTYAKVVAIIIASLIPFFLLTCVFITTDYYNSQKNVASANGQTMVYASAEIFSNLENLQIRLIQLLDTSEVGFFMVLSQPVDYAQRLYYAKQIQNQLMNIEVSSDYVKSILLVTDTGDIVSSSNITIGTDLEEESILAKALLADSGYFIYDGQLYMFTKVIFSPGKPATTIVTEMDKAGIIADIAKPFSSGNSICHVILLDGSYEWSAVADDSSKELQSIAESLKADFTDTDIKIEGKKYTIVSATDDFLNLRFMALVAGNPYVGNTSSVLLTVFTVLIAVIIIRMDQKLIKRIVAEPVNTLVTALENAEKEKYEIIPDATVQDEDFQYITERFNALIDKLQQSAAQMYEEKMRTREAELKHMQAQINPHFLYNSLFMISRLSKDGDNLLAGEFSNYLAKYFRYLTRSGSSLTTLEEEMNHLNIYIKIMSLRFYNRISTFIDNNVKNAGIMIPKLIIQPLAENAFEHGLKDTLYDGEIHIRLVQERNLLIVSVEDNGGNVTDEDLEEIRKYVYSGNETNKCTGLYNVNKRLRIYYGEDSGLIFEKNEWDGLKVIIRMDISSQEYMLNLSQSEKGDKKENE